MATFGPCSPPAFAGPLVESGNTLDPGVRTVPIQQAKMPYRMGYPCLALTLSPIVCTAGVFLSVTPGSGIHCDPGPARRLQVPPPKRLLGPTSIPAA